MKARAHRRERAREAINDLWGAMKSGRKPKAAYLENGSCFISRGFRRFCEEHEVKVIYGRPYHPRGRGKLERFRGILTQELVRRVSFRSRGHFRRELYPLRRQCNHVRLHGGIGWKTPAEVWNDPRLGRSGGPVRESRPLGDSLP